MKTTHAAGADALIAVGEAAALLTVHPDTLKRWEKAGRIASVRTPTGHRRFRRGDVEALLQPAAAHQAGAAVVSA